MGGWPLALVARTQAAPSSPREVVLAAYVYILASKRNGTLYIGVTNDLVRRVWEDREGVADGFTTIP